MALEISFGRWVHHLRQSLHMTQDTLGRLVGCSGAMIRKIEADERRPGPELASRLAKYLQVEADERNTFIRRARPGSLPHPRAAGQDQYGDAAFSHSPVVPGNLPTAATPLIGREQAIVSIHRLVVRQNWRLLTLTGPGGVGKTQLAIAAAARMRDLFPDGIFFVELAAITDPARVLTAVAQVVGVRESAAQPILDALRTVLHDRCLLLVLDNLEQVLDAATQIGDLLTIAPGLTVITTSREALHLSDEYEVIVPPLAVPELEQLPPVASLAGTAAVALFVERAAKAVEGFTLTSENACTVAEICHQLDGLPLAIELAAARMKVLSPGTLLNLLQRPFELLVGGPRNAPARQQTLLATLDWSYRLLDEDEQRLFRRLAAFVGGCTLEAVAAVCDDSPEPSTAASEQAFAVLDGLGSLLDKSLLRRIESTGGELRFVMLETIREYALERLLASGEADLVRRRHAAFFLALAETGEASLQGPDHGRWLLRLEAEHNNLRAALTWCTGADNRSATGLRLAGALWQFWDAHGHLQEGRRWLETMLARGSAAPEQLRAKVLYGLGTFSGGLPPHVARALLEESLMLRRKRGNKREIAASLCSLGITVGFQGDRAAGRTLLEEALKLYRDVRDQVGMAAALDNLGHIARWEGDYQTALTLQLESLKWRQKVKDTRGVAWSFNNLGWLEYAQHANDRAEPLFDLSLRLWRELGDRRSIAMELSNLGRVALRQGAYQRAAELFDESMELFYALNDLAAVVYVVEGCAGLAAIRWPSPAGSVHAAQIFGATEALREAAGYPLAPADRADYDGYVAASRRHVDEQTWQAAWAAGRVMTLEEAMTCARSSNPVPLAVDVPHLLPPDEDVS
ncbi:MAG TPA: tetratricopeptide repeat protein [Herpetosiphonaceae bacterium]|nr:tetratricopeptide repeat protein [Herpetosiphonaceae bacterium]